MRSDHGDVRPPATPAQQSAVLTKAMIRAADNLGLSDRILARIIGLSPASISRLKAGSTQIAAASKAFELAALFVRLFRGLDAIMGGDDDASRSWLASDNTALRGRPIDLIQTIIGLNAAVMYVDTRRARL